MTYVYNGHKANELNKDELIIAIMEEYKVPSDSGQQRDNLINAMAAVFREGWHRGEDFGKVYYQK